MIYRSKTISQLAPRIEYENPKIVDNITPIYRIIDEDGIIVDCNNFYLESLGYTRKETIGKSYHIHVPKSERNLEIKSFEMWKKDAVINNRDIILKKKNGKKITYYLTGRSFTENGKLRKKDIFRDISEIRKTRSDLRLVQYENLYESSSELYATINSRGVIVDCNESIEEKLGYTKDEMIGAQILDYADDEDYEKFTEFIKNLEHIKRNDSVVIKIKKKNTTIMQTRIVVIALINKNKRIVGANVILTDISESVNLKNELNSLEELNNQKVKFLIDISHQLRNPLTSIMGLTEVLSNEKLGKLNEKQKDYVLSILAETKILKFKIESLMKDQRMESDEWKPDVHSFEVKEVTDYLKKDFQTIMNENNIKFEVKIEKKLKMESDKSVLKEILQNLIYNAIDFTSEGKGKIKIDINSEGSSIIFSVSDNGIGIEDDKQMKIFERGFSDNGELSRQYGGTGVGLSICQNFIKNLGGGKMELISELKKGSTFIFKLPKTIKI